MWQKKRKWLYNSILAADTVEAIKTDLSYLSEYVMNHHQDDAIVDAHRFVQKLEGAKQNLEILIGQFKVRAAGKDPREGGR